ncbi:histidine kinase dimerization/phospho-acceptor domain-containing protein [Caldimonas tepidiphila]|uniref:histidine kinase dimerization/phospho-acceptor domain-containing protein n=1 Tax=Caldimonas tepidiphila TaxID=2315841 RepID=UPI0023502DA0|nr:histidine kinase dimerization/phospho-acceptor domain-containing protein [Caldimonas tepidiphila]
MVRDCTGKQSYIEGLENRRHEVASSTTYKEVTVTTLAHELRNPLTPLFHAVQLIRLSPSTQHLEQPLKIIDRQLEALRRLVDAAAACRFLKRAIGFCRDKAVRPSEAAGVATG